MKRYHEDATENDIKVENESIITQDVLNEFSEYLISKIDDAYNYLYDNIDYDVDYSNRRITYDFELNEYDVSNSDIRNMINLLSLEYSNDDTMDGYVRLGYYESYETEIQNESYIDISDYILKDENGNEINYDMIYNYIKDNDLIDSISERVHRSLKSNVPISERKIEKIIEYGNGKIIAFGYPEIEPEYIFAEYNDVIGYLKGEGIINEIPESIQPLIDSGAYSYSIDFRPVFGNHSDRVDLKNPEQHMSKIIAIVKKLLKMKLIKTKLFSFEGAIDKKDDKKSKSSKHGSARITLYRRILSKLVNRNNIFNLTNNKLLFLAENNKVNLYNRLYEISMASKVKDIDIEFEKASNINDLKDSIANNDSNTIYYVSGLSSDSEQYEFYFTSLNSKNEPIPYKLKLTRYYIEDMSDINNLEIDDDLSNRLQAISNKWEN